MMQRVTSTNGRVVVFAAAVVLVAALVVLWQRGLGDKKEVGDQEIGIGNRGEVTAITFACPDYQLDQFKSLARDFEGVNSDIRVQFLSSDEASGMQRQGNVATVDGRELARLTAAADTFVWYALLGADDWLFLLDLEPYVDDPSFPADDFFPGTLDHFRWRGGIYGLPARVLPMLMFYHPGMFDEAGLPYPHTGWTWDDFMQAVSQLTLREQGEVTRYGFVDTWSFSTVRAMMHQFGVSLWDDDADPPQPLFDTPEVADVLRRYASMALSYEIMPIPEFGSNLAASRLIDEEKVAVWTQSASGLVHNVRPTDPRAVTYPEGVNAALPRSIFGFFISAGTAHPEAAWRWLSYLSANYQPFLQGTLAGRRSVTERLSWWRELDEETKAVLEYAMAHPSPPDNPLERPLLRAVRAVFEDGMDVEQALARAQEQTLDLQASLARLTLTTPQPVATPQPIPGVGQTVITFAPAPGADVSLYRKLTIRFRESHPDVWVEVVPWSADLTELAASSDCFAGMYPAHVPQVRQQVRSLQPLLDADTQFDLSDVYPQFLSPFQQGGELWGLPYDASALMVYVNLDRFAEAEIAPPELGWSFQDFLSTAAALSEGDRYGFTTREGAYGDTIFVLERLGAQLFDDSHDPPAPTFDDPTVVVALGQYATLVRGCALTPRTPSTQSGWPDGLLVGMHPAGVQTAEVAMWVDSSEYHAFAGPLPFEVGIAPLPTQSGVEGPAGAQTSTEFDVNAYYISTHTSEPQICWEWLSFLSSQPDSVRAGQLPARRSVAASSAWREGVGEAALPAYQAVLSYTGTSIFDLRREIPWLGYAYPWLDEAFQAVVAGHDPQQALGEAQEKARALVTCLDVTEDVSDPDQLLACARHVDPDYPLAGPER